MTFSDTLDTFICNRLDTLALQEKSCEYKNLAEQANQLQKALIATFGSAQKDLFMELTEVRDQINGQECEDAYKAGLIDGVTLANRL